MQDNPVHSPKFMAFLAISSAIFIATGLFVQNLTNHTNSLDSRSQATTSNNPTLSLSTSPSNPIVNNPVTINLNLNTGSAAISALEIKNLTYSSTAILTNLSSSLAPTISALSPIVNSIDSQSSSIAYVAWLSNSTAGYSTSGQTQTIATFTMTPTTTGSVSLSFDNQNTLITEFNGDGSNILGGTTNLSFNVTSPSTSTPTPTPTSSTTTTTTTTTTETSNCDIPYAPQKVTARTGQNSGEIDVFWVRPGGHSYFAVSYGTKSGQYQWGSPNIGNTRSITLRFLQPGTRYYIIVSTINSCGGIKNSSEVSAIAAGAPATTKSITPPQVILIDTETPPTATPSATPEPQPEVEPYSGDQTLWDRIKSSRTLLIVFGIIGGLIISRLFKKKPPLPPHKTSFPKKDKSPQDEPPGPQPQPSSPPPPPSHHQTPA